MLDLVLLLAGILPTPLTPLAPADGILQPRTYVSPSGSYALEVVPLRRDGGGPGRYHLTRDGADIWSGEKSCTLWKAAVSDAGIAAGIAYSEGLGPIRGELRVVILSASGDVLLDEPHAIHAKAKRGGHGPTPEPTLRGLYIHEAIDRFVVRVDDVETPDGEPWWTYRLSTGEPLGIVRPRGPLTGEHPDGYSIEALALGSTPLALAQWYESDYPRQGTRFALVDPEYRAVWELDLPDDYETDGGAERDRLFEEVVWNPGAVLECKGQRFELRLVREHARVTFEAARDATAESGWRVSEIARVPYVSDEKAPIAIPQLRLETIASVDLAGPREESPRAIRDVLEFEFEPSGEIRFLRSEKEPRVFTLVTLDPGGRVTHETEFGPIEPEEKGQLAWARLDSSTWIVMLSPFGFGADAKNAKAWQVDVASGELAAIEEFECPSVKAIAATVDGFVAIATYSTEYTMIAALIAFDGDGQERWSVVQDFRDQDTLFAPEDLWVTRSGRIAVVENIKNRLQVFRSDGTLDHSIDLESAWGQEPRYPYGICGDGPEGVMVCDPSGSPPLWRMELDGTVHSHIAPRRADDSTDTSFARQARVAPDGRVWSTDGKVFVRFDDQGVVDRVLGDPPSTNTVNEVDAVAIDRLGRVLAHDGKSGAWHVFDSTGRRTAVCVPEANDFDTTRSLWQIQSADDGSIFVRGRSRRADYLEFNARGERVGPAGLGTGDMRFVPGSRERWVWGDSLRRIGAEAQVLSTIDHRPDGDWFREIEDVAVAPDGRLAALDGRRLRSGDRGNRAIALYSAQGEPVRMLELPPDARGRDLRYGDKWLLVGEYLVRADDGKVAKLDLSLPMERGKYTLGFAPDGRELWCVEHEPLRLHRYELPE